MRLPGSDPEVWAVAGGGFKLVNVGGCALVGQRPVFRGDVGEGGADGVAHRLGAAHVDVAAGSEQAPDERALLPYPALDVIMAAGRLTGRGNVHVIERAFRGEVLEIRSIAMPPSAMSHERATAYVDELEATARYRPDLWV